MNKYVTWIGGVVILGAAYLYYRKKTQAVQQQDFVNPNASVDNNIASILTNSTYQGNTGQTGDTYTANYRYAEYQSYLNQGGTQSGSTFDQYLTAAQGNSLPVNS